MAELHLRMYPRVSVNFPVECSLGNRIFRQRATNLGGGGLFLTGLKALSPGTELTLQFRPAKHLPIVQAKAQVRHELPQQGVGLEFVQITPEDRALLLRLIHRKTGNKRTSPRAPLATQVECNECMSLAFSRDIGLRGMFIETDQPLPIGSKASLRFNLDDGGPIIVVSAEVAYEIPKLGMGVLFIDLPKEVQDRIVTYVTNPPAPRAPESGSTA